MPSSDKYSSRVLKNDIASALGINSKRIKLAKLGREHHKKPRFVYGFTSPTTRMGKKIPAGFFKVAETKYTKQLVRESMAMKVAKDQLGVPTIDIITPAKKLPQGRVILELAYLDFKKDGKVILNNDQLSKTSSVFGARAARTLCSFSGQVVPRSVNHKIFKRGDWRNKSPKSFWRKWEKHVGIVLDSKFDKTVEDLIGTDRLREIINSTEKDIKFLFRLNKEQGKMYLVHNDASPSNMFFRRDGTTLLLDFEHVGITRHKVLALLTDLGNFAGRCWPNIKMQQKFLMECLKNKILGPVEYRRRMVRTVLVFGTIYLAKYGMSSRSKEHKISVSLLKNLESSLKKIGGMQLQS